MNLFTPIEEIPRIGLIYQKRLKRLGIKTVEDLLWHFPHRYEDFSNIIPINEIKLNKTCCVRGKILSIKNTRTWKRKMIITQAIIQDNTAPLKIVWFNQPYLVKNLSPGTLVCLAGKATLKDNEIYLNNPIYEKITTRSELTHTGRIVPVYPLKEGLSSRWLRYIIRPLLSFLGDKIKDPLPEEILKEHGLLPIKKALWQIHFPGSLKLAHEAKKRFSFEQLFYIELFVLRERLKLTK